MTEEKEQKPKKLFTITIDIYDSGDVDSSMVEYRKSGSGVGRPRKWELTPVDFVTRVEEILGDYNKCLAEWNNAIGKEAKQLLGMESKIKAEKIMSQAAGESQASQKKEISQSKPKTNKVDKVDDSADVESPDNFGDMNFGDFDTPTNQ